MNIILQSPDGRFFRKIESDGSFYHKTLGFPWEKHDPEKISGKELQRYLETMTTKLKWKATQQ